MKATLIACQAALLDDLRRSVQDAGYEISQAHLRKAGQPLQGLLPSGGELLIVDSPPAQSQDDLAALEALTGAQPALDVILLSAQREADDLIAAMRAGVREVLAAPPGAELAPALRRLAQRKPATGARHRTIAFIACKGGSGATFLATNLAYLLATEHGKDVALIDLDLQYGDASYFVTDSPGTANIADLARQIERLDAKLLAASMTQVAPNFQLLAAPENPEDALAITPAQLGRILDVAGENHEYVLLDVERMLDALAIKALDKAEVIFMVMENMVPFVRDARRLARILRSLGYPDSKLRLIVNRYDKHSQVDLAQIEKAVGLKVDHTIPNHPADVAEAVNTGVALAKVNPHNAVARALRELAAELADKHVGSARGWFARLLGEQV